MNRHGYRAHTALALIVTLLLGACSVYTVKPGHFQYTLKQKTPRTKGLALNSVTEIRKGKNHNTLDTLSFYKHNGKKLLKKFSYDSRITVVTKDQKQISYYAKTLYIWKDQYLIGERTGLSLSGPNYYPVKLENIERLEVKGL
jgi:hypothetical protein